MTMSAQALADYASMRVAINLAIWAESIGKRPFACIIVDPDDEIVGAGTGSGTLTDPTLHSEIVAIRMACVETGGRLRGCTLYSTHEPCPMCCGAINHAKVSRVVYGSRRHDLPRLFRHTRIPVYDRLRDTTNPPEIKRVLTNECVSLFDAEVACAAR